MPICVLWPNIFVEKNNRSLCSESLISTPIDRAASIMSNQMCKVIEGENELLKTTFAHFLKKERSPPEFTQIKSGLFLYFSDYYIAMSIVTLTLLQRCSIHFEEVVYSPQDLVQIVNMDLMMVSCRF